MDNIPLATYRIQFHPGFTFEDAAAVAGYLKDLGVSHVYASPYLQASRGSSHGYDVVDPGKVNEELGGSAGHRKFCAALKKNGLGQVLDVVPNHMAIGGTQNVWWWDVLEDGPSSPYAAYFDVEWHPVDERTGNQILLPILGDHYGKVLEAGEIRLFHDRGLFTVHYFDHRFPVTPGSLVGLLERASEKSGSEKLAFITDALRHLPLPMAHEFENTRKRHRNWGFLQDLLMDTLQETPEVSNAVDRVVEEINSSFDLLDDFLGEQNYRLAFWKSAARDLGYRRFFDINSLIGIRVEDEDVFFDTHRLLIGWLGEGLLDGIRIDHPDGLRDPEQYFKRLRKVAPDTWIVVEKILHPEEKLPAAWPVEGTTGYDFLNLLGGLMIHPSGEKPMTDFYREFTGEETDYNFLSREKKHQVLHELLASEVNRLTDLMLRICEMHRRYRDYSRWEINEAIRELVACFPVYRTYVRENEEIREEDRGVIKTVIERAMSERQELDPELFNFMESLLLLEHRGDTETEWTMRFQQLTGPATAKGIEDTAFYCFNRMISLNEVGGDPSVFGVSPANFHNAMEEAVKLKPHSMLATSTHDTKRSEDVRARLALLSEVPELWQESVVRWSMHNRSCCTGEFPDKNTEYLLYQTMVGAWPIERDRLLAFMEKAVREAKVHTSWTKPDPDYEKAVFDFVNRIFDDREFLADLEKFIFPLILPGRINSLAQVLVKLTAPGVPDMYQGTELWDLSLVDPDNRRPVDFEYRKGLLKEIKGLSIEEIASRMDEGLPKLWTTYRALEIRRLLPDVFRSGDYRPLYAEGPKAHHLAAFLRGGRVAAIVPRFPLSLNNEWGDTRMELPEGLWHNQLTGEVIAGGKTAVRELFGKFPVALFKRE